MSPFRWLATPLLGLLLMAGIATAAPKGKATPPVGAGPQGISDLAPIALTSGVNELKRFSPDGRDALIVRAWRDNGNAWGHNTYLVMMKPTADGGGIRGGWNLVSVEAETPPGVAEIVRDSPHTFEDAIRSVVFAHGKVDGRPQTLLLIATRTVKDAVPDPAPTTIAIYQLVVNAQEDDPVGDTVDAFHRIRSWQTKKPYCSSDAALVKELGLPRPEGSEAPDTADGCQ